MKLHSAKRSFSLAAALAVLPLTLHAEAAPAAAPAPVQAAPPSAASSAPVTLRYKFAVGQVRRYQLSMDMNMLMNTGQTGAGIPLSMTMQTVMAQTVKSIRPSDGAATVVTTIEAMHMLQNGQETALPEAQQAKLKQPVTQVMLPSGKILSLESPALSENGMPGMDFSRGAFTTPALLPDGPVKPGDHWGGTASVNGVEVSSASTLTGIDRKNGVNLAAIHNTQTGMMDMMMTKGLPASMKISGPITGDAAQVFDIASGAIQSAAGTSNTDLTMTFGKAADGSLPPGMPPAMKMQMQMKYTMQRLSDTASTSVPIVEASVLQTAKFANAFEDTLNTDDVDAVKALLVQGMSPNQNASTGDPLLYHAVYSEAPKVTQLLLSKGADVNKMSPTQNMTPLMSALASKTPNKQMFDMLMSAKPDLGLEDNFGDTALDIVELETGITLSKDTGVAPALSADNMAILKALKAAQAPHGDQQETIRSTDRLLVAHVTAYSVDAAGIATITGRLTNYSKVHYNYVEVGAKFVGDNDRLIDTSLDNITGLDAGETWNFKISTLKEGSTKYHLTTITAH